MPAHAAHLYVTALVKDPTPENRETDFDSDYVALGVDGNRLRGVAYDANDIYVAHRFDNKRIEGAYGGVVIPSTLTPAGTALCNQISSSFASNQCPAPDAGVGDGGTDTADAATGG